MHSSRHCRAQIILSVAGFGLASVYLVPWSMLPDVIDASEVISHERSESIYYAFFVFFQKFGTVWMPWIDVCFTHTSVVLVDLGLGYRRFDALAAVCWLHLIAVLHRWWHHSGGELSALLA